MQTLSAYEEEMSDDDYDGMGNPVRAVAVNLARNLRIDGRGFATEKAVKCLVDAVLSMDKELFQLRADNEVLKAGNKAFRLLLNDAAKLGDYTPVGGIIEATSPEPWEKA